ncbi:terminase large subunit, partial [Pseudomonadota bacterium]
DVFTAATSKDQANIVFQDCKEMVTASPALQRYINRRQYSLNVASRNSTMKAVASKAGSLEGLNPTLAILDEVHANPNGEIISVFELAMGASEGLIFMISTAGTDPNSPIHAKYEYADMVLKGAANDDTYHPVIFELDDEDDHHLEANWHKANPNLGVSVSKDDLHTQVMRADALASEMTNLLTKRFNRFVTGDTAYISRKQWGELAGLRSLEELKGRPCFLGLDISSKRDMTALTFVFPGEGNQDVYITGKYYVPESCLDWSKNKNADLYDGWRRDGWLTVTEGAVLDDQVIWNDIRQACRDFKVQDIGFDRWGSNWITTQAMTVCDTVTAVPQTLAALSPPTKELEVYALSGKVSHDGNPILSWAFGNVVLMSDSNDNVKPDKAKSANKIDPVISLITAFNRYLATVEVKPALPNIRF